MYSDLEGKIVVVTGAGAGIGQGIALRFAKEGATAVVNDLRAEEANKVADAITGSGGCALAWAGDMTDENDVNALFDRVLQEFGRVDVLVNNVGFFGFGDLVGASLEEWNRSISINATSAFLCSNRAAQEMIKAGAGSIINISSGASRIAATGSTAYGVAKVAMIGLTRTLAAELAPHIRVNAVMPGIIGTQMDENFVNIISKKQGVTPEEFKKGRAASIPLKRVGTPEDVANVVAFLASDQACYITGASINLTGGLVVD